MIDLSDMRMLHDDPPAALVNDVAKACEEWGFFQIVNHGVDASLRARAEQQQRAFFSLPESVKEGMRRSVRRRAPQSDYALKQCLLMRRHRTVRAQADNSRGWYNDELTKQRRDWKEGLDFGSTPPMDWALSVRIGHEACCSDAARCGCRTFSSSHHASQGCRRSQRHARWLQPLPATRGAA
ncbi:2-oxoglutarate and iron-dependent oxygenase domain-containing protein [bacterium]|nr:2-oxoglutarate and iron-dependent oxygenase domain-containing protein [bacterium]